MALTDLLAAQLTDVFRIGLIAALLFTTLRNRAVTGLVLPLLAGIVFVAVIIPVTQPGAEDLPRVVGVGVVANVILAGIGFGIWQAYRRLTGK